MSDSMKRIDRWILACLILVVVLLGMNATASAQVTPPRDGSSEASASVDTADLGARLRVHTLTETYAGTLREVAPADIGLQRRGRDLVLFLTRSEIERAELSLGKNRWRGAAVGGAIGAAVGGMIGYATGEDCGESRGNGGTDGWFSIDLCFSRPENAAMAAVVGAPVGAALGALIGWERWTPVVLPTAEGATVGLVWR